MHRYDPTALAPELATRRAAKVERMAETLLCSAVDLGDERACILLLQTSGELARDIDTFLDDAIAAARARMQKETAA